MHSLAIPCVAMSAINGYLGGYHLILALRRPQAREHLPFALLCLVVAAYDLFCVGLYNATSLAQGVFWQRQQVRSVALISMLTLWFVGRLIGAERKRGIRVFIAWFVVLTPLSLGQSTSLVLESVPALKHIVWAQRPLITYYEGDVGPGFLLVVVSALLAYGYLVAALVRHYRQGRSRHVLSLLIGNAAYFAGVINDSSVASRIYSFIYVSEYAFFILTLSMAYVLLNRFVDLQVNVEALNVNLERAVVQRTAALHRSLEQQSAMQEQLLDASRRSGMAAVASEVLHNVGNALNSVNVSVELLKGTLQQSRLSGLTKVVRMLGEHKDGLAGFVASDARARRLPEYLAAATTQLEDERGSFASELESLRKHVDDIMVVIAAQLSHAGAPAVTKATSLAAVLDDALSTGLARSAGSGVELQRVYESIPDVAIDRHKVEHIVARLIANACDAIDGSTAADKRIWVRLRALDPGRVAIEVEDSGCGIAPENLTRIFNHGFTTRQDRRGFGLHVASCATSELGGTLVAASEGPGRGARFTLTLPHGGADAASPPVR